MQRLEDWYTVKSRDVLSQPGGSGITQGGSVVRALKLAYPEHPWQLSKVFEKNFCLFYSYLQFVTIPYSYWNDQENRKRFFEDLEQQWGMKDKGDWYEVSVRSVRDARGSGILDRYYEGSLMKALGDLFPEYDWNPYAFRAKPRNFWTPDRVSDFLREYADKVPLLSRIFAAK